ncbi:MAG: hypothetical protein WCT52_05590 [Candidatus Micrarchaeia archaeon]
MATILREKPKAVLIGASCGNGAHYKVNSAVTEKSFALAWKLQENMRPTLLVSHYAPKTESLLFIVSGIGGKPPDARMVGRVMRAALENSDGTIN